MTNSEYMKLVRFLKDQNKSHSLFLQSVPRHLWPENNDSTRTGLYRSSDFVVQEFTDPMKPIRLSINRTMIDRTGNWTAGITWDQIQDLKRQCGYGGKWALEIYPDDRHVVNVANIRHIWLLDESPEFAWRRGK